MASSNNAPAYHTESANRSLRELLARTASIVILSSLISPLIQAAEPKAKEYSTQISAEPLEPGSGEAEDELDIAWLPKSVKRWEPLIEEQAARYDLDPNLIAILMTLESGGWAAAKSPVGAQGLMQIMPATAADIAQMHLQEPVAEYDILDPETNIAFGASYLKWLIDNYTGESSHGPSWDATVQLTAAGYNGGPGAALHLLEHDTFYSDETRNYARNALYMWRERHQNTSPTFEQWKQNGGSRLIEAAMNET